MDFESIQEIIKAVSDSSLSFFEMETDGVFLKMKKGTDKVYVKDSVGPQQIVKASVDDNKIFEKPLNEVPTVKAEENIQVPETKKQNNYFEVKSPIVGTFFAASSPDAEPFAKVGSKVKKGDTLCIIEAMKLMNEIDSEVDGEIAEVHVKSGDMVEYGQVLFSIINN